MESETEIQHVASGKHSEYWKAPELIESSLKQTAMIYRKFLDEENKKELLNCLKNDLEQTQTYYPWYGIECKRYS